LCPFIVVFVAKLCLNFCTTFNKVRGLIDTN
jgi:hypothetical protein